MRIPRHIGLIPDGNRRWAENRGLPKEAGYEKGLYPGLQFFKLCKELGVEEVTYYGFTQDNTKRPAVQRKEFSRACVEAVKMLFQEDAELMVVGNAESPMFPEELLPYIRRKKIGKGGIRVNFLVNYGWQWDLNNALKNNHENNISKCIYSSDVSRIDLIMRWGGRRRLSGFLPVQSIYADVYITDDLWPDFEPEQFYEGIKWYSQQDITLGG